MTDNNEIMLKILEKFTELQTDMKDMKSELNSIKKKKSSGKSGSSTSSGSSSDDEEEYVKKKKEPKIREVKLEKINIPVEFVKRCIKYNSMQGDMLIFKHWYLDKSEEPPIRNINRQRWDFYCNGTWNMDIEGEYIKDVICKNIQKAYMSVNTIDYFEDDFDVFIDNQKHIMELSDPKYKKRVLSGIKEFLRADVIPLISASKK